jgi:hypothetical protein
MTVILAYGFYILCCGAVTMGIIGMLKRTSACGDCNEPCIYCERKRRKS